MNKKIITIVILSATLILGLPAFIQSPYYALALGDLDLYHELKANRVAVDKCDTIAGDDEALFQSCFHSEKTRVLSKR